MGACCGVQSAVWRSQHSNLKEPKKTISSFQKWLQIAVQTTLGGALHRASFGVVPFFVDVLFCLRSF